MSISAGIGSDLSAAIAEFGRSITYTVNTEGTYDPSTGAMTGDSETDYTVNAIIMSYKERDIDGTRIQATDKKCILSASDLAVTPTTGDIVTVGSTKYTVIVPKTYEVEGSVFGYVLQVRDAS